MLSGMEESRFDEWIAEHYERLWPELFDPAVLGPTVEFLARVAGSGTALEFGVGTGRVALPLARNGIGVTGIELSSAMVGQLQARPGASVIDVRIGDFARTRIDRRFALVYLVRNTITNLTTQHAQIQCFLNAATHLQPGGCFVIENYVPELRRLPPGETRHVFVATPDHLGFEEYDIVEQIAVSHHYWIIDGQLEARSGAHRYVWPSELDLMARLAGLSLRERWSNWHRAPFTNESRSHISVWQAPT